MPWINRGKSVSRVLCLLSFQPRYIIFQKNGTQQKKREEGGKNHNQPDKPERESRISAATLSPAEATESDVDNGVQNSCPATWVLSSHQEGKRGMGRDQVESQGVWPELPVDILDSLASLKRRSS